MIGEGRIGTVLLSCGEPSGDVYAADVARQLQERYPEVRLVGIGGPLLQSQVSQMWGGLDELSVMGFTEVLRHLPRLRQLRGQWAQRARVEGVNLLLAVDYPGFNIALAAAMHAHGIPTLSYIPPKTWSWGAWRNRSLRKSVARCAVIFPFEEDYYRVRQIDARFVGHPLLDRHSARLEHPRPRNGLLLVPGSRRQEILRIGPIVGAAAARVLQSGAVDEVRISRAPGVELDWLETIRRHVPAAALVEGVLFEQLQQSAAAIVTSGTATVEAALSRTPHAIVYKTSPTTYWLARALATVPAIGMANIVLERVAFPEFVQSGLQATPLAKTIEALVAEDSASAATQREAFDELRGRLGRGEGAAANVAEMAVQMLDGG